MTPGLSTQSVHAGEQRAKAHHSITPPIVQSSTYTFADTAALVEYMEERMFWDAPQREEYGRYGNPTVRAVEARLAALGISPSLIRLACGIEDTVDLLADLEQALGGV